MFKPAPAVDSDLARLAVNTLKFLSVDQVEKANSGHPGLPMGAADYAFVLWSRYLKFDPKDPAWPDRDRFILSAGHGSALLYSLLNLSGYDLPMEELMRFRQWGSKTPGHPEAHMTPGVEATTGPLGQGFANGVGMALAARMADARCPGLFDHRIWAIVSDGDLMEGVASEAASTAGHLKLGNLKYLYDANQITLDGNLSEIFDEDVAKRFESYGWAVKTIDGHDHVAIAGALDWACGENSKPVMVICKTHIGNGAPNKHDTHKVHGEPLGKEEMEATRKALSWPLDKTFFVPEPVKALWQKRAEELGRVHDEWRDKEKAWLAADAPRAEAYRTLSARKAPADLYAQLRTAIPKDMDATRSLAGTIEQKACALMPSLVGGDADLGGSTKTPIKDSTKITPESFAGKNIRFGIREHAMGALANGISLYGMFVPFTATFLTFSDYMRPPIRLAGLSHTQAIHVFTHDSVFLGEDGPTHQSVEHVSALRLIPNVDVWRPADGLECAAAWAGSLARTSGPSEIILSRQKVDALPAGVNPDDVARGAYVLVREQGGAPEVTIMATGSEVGVAVSAGAELAKAGKRVRVVSMPCWEVFDRQDAGYRAAVLPTSGRRVSIEAGRTDLWHRWIGIDGLAIGIDHYGASAPAKILAEEFGLSPGKVLARIKDFLG